MRRGVVGRVPREKPRSAQPREHGPWSHAVAHLFTIKTSRAPPFSLASTGDDALSPHGNAPGAPQPLPQTSSPHPFSPSSSAPP
jgi:hypothetical protein